VLHQDRQSTEVTLIVAVPFDDVSGEETCNDHVRAEVFTAVTMKNVVLWDTKHRRQITFPLQSPVG
jgi:hypothetical protein